MPKIEIDETLWNAFLTLCEKHQAQDPTRFLELWLWDIIRREELADGRYLPAVAGIITRNESEILVVGNEYSKGRSLTWNFPGGAVDPGEDLRSALVREVHEETGLKVLEIGRLACVSQVYSGADSTGLLFFMFEIKSWEGEVSLENEVQGGPVRAVEFVSYDDALERVMAGIAKPFREWVDEPDGAPRMYWFDGSGEAESRG
jgi:8-oxo-dGTP diphosphatase